jgi:zinc transport system substrate-binding protein
MHIWLEAGNARAIVRAAVLALGTADPANAAAYRANGEAVQTRLAQLDIRLRAELLPLAGRPYVVFHDAYQYFERRYGLTSAGSITVSPDRQPSARRVAAIRKKIEGSRAVCVFSEPQFQPALVQTLVAGTDARIGMLDADGGIGVPPGPDAYFTILSNLGMSLKDCLASSS